MLSSSSGLLPLDGGLLHHLGGLRDGLDHRDRRGARRRGDACLPVGLLDRLAVLPDVLVEVLVRQVLAAGVHPLVPPRQLAGDQVLGLLALEARLLPLVVGADVLQENDAELGHDLPLSTPRRTRAARAAWDYEARAGLLTAPPRTKAAAQA